MQENKNEKFEIIGDTPPEESQEELRKEIIKSKEYKDPPEWVDKIKELKGMMEEMRKDKDFDNVFNMNELKGNFGVRLRDKFNKENSLSTDNYRLYHLLGGSTPRPGDKFSEFDFPNDPEEPNIDYSIENFIRGLYETWKGLDKRNK